MTNRDESFQPESIDEYLQQLKQAASYSDGSTIPDARLVQDLRSIHTDYTQSGQRVWNRLAERLAEPNESANHLKLLTNEIAQTERSSYMQTEQSEIGPMPAIQPNRPPRKVRRLFTLVAALLVAALLIGSIFVIITNMHPYSGVAAAPTPTPTPRPTLTATARNSFPASDCPSQTNPNVSPNPATWYQLCKAGKFTLVNQSSHMTHPYSFNETIEAAYADRNMLFLFYNFSPIKATDVPKAINTLITKQGTQLKQLGGSEGFFSKNQQFTWIVGYDTSNLPSNLQTLTVKVSSNVSIQSTGPYVAIPSNKIGVASFSVPLYSARVLAPNQTVTANGAAITLAKAIIGASGVHLIFSASHIPDLAVGSSFTGTLQAGKLNASNDTYALNTKKGSTLVVPTGFELTFDSDLTSEHGAWTLTVKATGESQPWIFHFAVPV